MYDFIDYNGEKRPGWSDNQFYWMAVCEHITAHWYFVLSMEEFADLYHLKYPNVPAKEVRDAYVFQYYSELNYRGQEMFDKEISKRDTKLTPAVVKPSGATGGEPDEYLVSNAAEDREELFDKALDLHSKRPMYVPKVQEMEEYFQLGFTPGNDKVMEAFAQLSELIEFKNSVRGDPKVTKAAVEKENANRDHLAQGAVLSMIRTLERGGSFEEISKKLIKELPFSDEFAALMQLREVYNNTHLPGNNGWTPADLHLPGSNG